MPRDLSDPLAALFDQAAWLSVLDRLDKVPDVDNLEPLWTYVERLKSRAEHSGRRYRSSATRRSMTSSTFATGAFCANASDSFATVR